MEDSKTLLAAREVDRTREDCLKTGKAYDEAYKYRHELMNVDGGRIALKAADEKLALATAPFQEAQAKYNNARESFVRSLNEKYPEKDKEENFLSI